MMKQLKNKTRLAIIGSSALGQLAAYHANSDSGYEVVGYYDDFNVGEQILGTTKEIESDYNKGKFDQLFIGIGYDNMKARSDKFQLFKNKIPFANIIHSSSYVDPSCQLGEGIFILPGCTLDMSVILEDNIVLNTGVTIAHHSKVSEHSFLGPAVAVAGLVEIGNSCFIGLNASIIDCISISNNCIVGAGSVVIRNLDQFTTNVGNPSKLLKTRE